MAENGPVYVGVLELLNANLTSEGTVGLVEDVLGGNTELLVGEVAGVGEVEGGRGDDDLAVVVELSGVEVVDDGLDALGRAVPMWLLDSWKWDGGAPRGIAGQLVDHHVHLEVSSDEEFARHDGGVGYVD